MAKGAAKTKVSQYFICLLGSFAIKRRITSNRFRKTESENKLHVGSFPPLRLVSTKIQFLNMKLHNFVKTTENELKFEI